LTPTEQIFDWIEHTDLSMWVRGESLFAFPLILTVHTIGMGFVAGTSWAVDLRVLGVGKSVPLAAMEKVFPVIWLALAANFISGVFLFIAYPYKAFTNPVFYVKLSLIALSIYLIVKVKNEVLRHEPSDEIHWRRAKILAAASLAAWAAAITAGRLLAYTFIWLRVGIPGGF
jgi:hypothetical protein